MTALTISDLSQGSPDMTDEAFTRFKADIKQHGQLVPIVLIGTEVVDGRKRLRACTELGVAPKTIQLDGGQSAESAAKSLNLLRTHYTHGQIGMYAAKIARRPRGPNKMSSLNSGMTEADAGKSFGLPTSTVTFAKSIRRDAHPEVTAAVEAGKITLGAARKIAKLSKDEQPAHVAKAIAGARGPARRQQPSNPSRFGQRGKAKPAAERFARAVLALTTTLEAMKDSLPTICAEGGGRVHLDELSRGRRILATVIHAIEEAT